MTPTMTLRLRPKFSAPPAAPGVSPNTGTTLKYGLLLLLGVSIPDLIIGLIFVR